MKTSIIKNILFVILFFVAFSSVFGQSTLEFAKPGTENRPWVYWFWNNGNLTQEGIDADLEAMHRTGIGGVLIMEVGQGAPRGPVDYMSDRWRELFKHMISKAASLGIEVNMNNGPGWNGSSGTWIKPENAMKELTFQIVDVPAENRPDKTVFAPGKKVYDYYRDVCVLAFPTPEKKTNLGFLPVDVKRFRTPLQSIPIESFVPLNTVIDISDKMNHAGEINWKIPAGNWTLIRIGVTCKLRAGGIYPESHIRLETLDPVFPEIIGGPFPESCFGLECDKLSKRGMDNAFEGQIGKLIADNKSHVGKTFVATHIDSWENGSQTWTDDMREEFMKRRNYDILKFLPVFAGFAIENPEYTERFLWDFRRTVSELVLENYAGRIKELAGQNGLRFTAEAYWGAPCDNLQYAGITDEPMGEFWLDGLQMNTCRGMASAGHIYGKRIIGVEAFTANGLERWLAHPGSIKAMGDKAFSEGVNRIVFHRYSFQPWKDVKPGLMMGPWGIRYERTQTWWELTPAWHEYLSRCQYMLRQGKFVADILYLEPEDSPQKFTEQPRNGFQWDQGNTDVVLKATVENGMIVLPSGMKYRILVLPPTNLMTEQLLEKTLQLVQEGATVIGNQRATAAPDLTDYPNNDRRVKELAQKIWGNVNMESEEHHVGKGKVFWGTTPEVILTEMNLAPNFVSNVPLNWIHRRLPDTEIFFIANPRDQTVLADIQLRGFGKPELWIPETGEIIPTTALQTAPGTTRLMLTLRATESLFVVIRKSPSDLESRPNKWQLARLAKDGKRLFDFTEPFGKITVTSANYGTVSNLGKMVNVKPSVEKLVDVGERQIPVDRISKQQGKSDSNTDKTLIINFEIDGKQYVVSGKDGETLILDKMFPSLKILNATYGPPGDEKRTIDVREKLQGFFDRGENNFLVSRLSQPVDPALGVLKTLRFEYEMNDKTEVWIGNDRTRILLKNEQLPDVPICYPVSDVYGRTCVDFHESGNYELTFTSNKKRTETVSLPQPLLLDDDWKVVFPHKTVTFDKLTSWSESTDDSIEYFSGTAIYTKSFTLPKNLRKKDLRIMLDLGQTEVMAQIELNGKNLDLLWKVEKSVDITDWLKSGENHLKISVTNLWPNRLIGDARLPASDERNANGTLKAWPQWLLDGKPDPVGRSTFCMWNLWKADDTLVPSGLIGPVQLLPIKRVVVE